MLELRFLGLRKAITMLVICGGLSAPLVAKPANPKPAKDPNEKICEKQPVIGSRLATRRVCATRAEWEEKRRLDKEAIDIAQKSACTPQAGC
jgi:hypothetical protein